MTDQDWLYLASLVFTFFAVFGLCEFTTHLFTRRPKPSAQPLDKLLSQLETTANGRDYTASVVIDHEGQVTVHVSYNEVTQ